ncbi:lytic transglycosylase domain-containing protein [Lysobacter sp. S4-A87]|uniref:lytic transglycosylase domain-containing protein n=1 Tax=Lysobacter sp. S4-A87 TaxID=2925843 RepID=UPI001F539896|nr:lytic transglycosylase domain-containing protein [Lysobacter sp. S4-A87]UNK50616.1 lytic transglycosylase domain-containing protein [Lysobacter sp. S4-A87]
MSVKAGAWWLRVVCLLALSPVVAAGPGRCERAGEPLVASAGAVSAPACPGTVDAAPLGRVSQPSMPARVGETAQLPPVARELQQPQVASTATAAPVAPVSMRVAQGEVYSYTSGGELVYSSRRPEAAAGIGPVSRVRYTYMETCYACDLQPGVDFGTVSLNTDAYRREIASAARDFGVDESVVRAVIHAESAYNPRALSRVGAQGLMQLMPDTARRFGVANVFDIGQNIRGGVQYLAWLLKRFNGNLTLAAAGYNAGEGAVDRYRGVPPYSETQRYVERVAVLADRYRNARAAP